MKTKPVTEGPVRYHAQKAFNALMSPPPHSCVTIVRVHPRTGVEIPIDIDYYLLKDKPEIQLGDAINKRTGSEVWLSTTEKQQAIELAWLDMKEMGKLKESRMIRTTVGTLRSAVRKIMETYQKLHKFISFNREIEIDGELQEIKIEYVEYRDDYEIINAYLPDGTPTDLNRQELTLVDDLIIKKAKDEAYANFSPPY